MTIALKEWNILDHLKTEEDITLYLEACFEEAGDDSNFIAQALNDVAKAKHLTVANETEKPSSDAVFNLIKTLGFQLQIAPAKNLAHLS
jgi:DNA-binding phage protein